MDSYEGRLQTFEKWPAEYKNGFTKRLAIMGQYSIDESKRLTCCIYCNEISSGWNLQDNPLLKHFESKNSKCMIYKLCYASQRKLFSRMLKENDNTILSEKFIQLNISQEKPITVCIICGSSDVNHKCKEAIQKINSQMDIEKSQFYIKYLSGHYNEAFDLYLDNSHTLSQEKKDILAYFMDKNPKYAPFDSLETFLQASSGSFLEEVEVKLRKIENEAIAAIYEDSIAS